VLPLICLVTRMRRRDDRSSSQVIVYVSGKYGQTKNSCLLSMKKKNGSRHLVFWSIGTLTGLKDRVRGLVA